MLVTSFGTCKREDKEYDTLERSSRWEELRAAAAGMVTCTVRCRFFSETSPRGYPPCSPWLSDCRLQSTRGICTLHIECPLEEASLRATRTRVGRELLTSVLRVPVRYSVRVYCLTLQPPRFIPRVIEQTPTLWSLLFPIKADYNRSRICQMLVYHTCILRKASRR